MDTYVEMEMGSSVQASLTAATCCELECQTFTDLTWTGQLGRGQAFGSLDQTYSNLARPRSCLLLTTRRILGLEFKSEVIRSLVKRGRAGFE